jgi:hypothetical protein
MRGVSKHLERLDGIWLEGAVEHQEPSEGQLAFNICPVKFVDLKNKSANEIN